VSETIPPRRIWLALEGAEIVNLKQVMLDRDVPGAVAFFQRVVILGVGIYFLWTA